jgi:hypothetical protein
MAAVSPEGRDPLGKRALFWAPATRVEDPPRPGDEVPEDVGKYALYTRFSDPLPDAAAETDRPSSFPPGVMGLVPPVEMACSSCGARSQVDVLRYLALHAPFFLWRPGRGYTRFMTCPSCRHRTWLSASWTPWSAR